MYVRLKLLGTLSSCYPGHYPPAGLNIEIAAGATVADLVERSGIAQERVAIVTINGVLAKAGDRVPENAVVKFMQPVTGG
ncbi:MAG: MoaD/ThiS family protein [Desulfoprunum sp.]|nr:MoaD/ThiS family protein [Desulfoprunum sp.]